ncbi:MAG: phosphoribosyltransferase [Planctomycetota bacterium]
MGETIMNVGKRVAGPYVAFHDRADAGRALAAELHTGVEERAVVLALPRGGVPVGEPLAETLEAPLDVVPVRKLPVPSSPEMGFGAVAIDGTRVLNRPVVDRLGLSDEEIDRIAEEVRQEVERRAAAYGGTNASPEVRGSTAYLVDDGLATGFSMIAAARMVSKSRPDRLVLAVPVSPAGSLRAVQPYFQEVHCLIVQEGPPFAVASFYEDFHDLSDQEVQTLLARRRGSDSI